MSLASALLPLDDNSILSLSLLDRVLRPTLRPWHNQVAETFPIPQPSPSPACGPQQLLAVGPILPLLWAANRNIANNAL
jgi:hypothetical protein